MILNIDKSQKVHIIVGLASALVAVLLPFVVFSENDSVQAVKHFGYWGMLSLLMFFLWFLLYEIPSVYSLVKIVCKEWLPIVVSVMCSLYFMAHYKFEYRILFDEYVISNISLSMSARNKAASSSYEPHANAVVEPIVSKVDKRPVFFPFALSVVHDILGYSPYNVFLLNSILTFVLFLLLYRFVSSLAGKIWGLFSQLSLAGLPLVAMSSTSAGYEIMNLCWILVVCFFGVKYLFSDGTRYLDLFLVSVLILANCRYESILYSVVSVGVFLYKGLRDRSVAITPFASLSPLFLLFPLMSNRVFYSSEDHFQTTKDSFFGLDYFLKNFEGAFRFLFDISGIYSGSIFVSVFAVLACVLLGVGVYSMIFRENRDRVGLGLLFFLVMFGAVVLANTCMALSMFWGDWRDPTTSRFSLPLHLLLVLLLPWSWSIVTNSKRPPWWIPALPMLYIVAWASCVSGREMVRPRFLGSYTYNKVFDEVLMDWNNDDTFVMTSATLGAALFGFYSESLVNSEQINRQLVNRQIGTGIYSRVLFSRLDSSSPFGGQTIDAFMGGEDGFENSKECSGFIIMDPVYRKKYMFDQEFCIGVIKGLKMPVPSADTVQVPEASDRAAE